MWMLDEAHGIRQAYNIVGSWKCIVEHPLGNASRSGWNNIYPEWDMEANEISAQVNEIEMEKGWIMLIKHHSRLKAHGSR